MQSFEIDGYEELLETADLQAKTRWEMDFVEDMKEKYEAYGENTFVSDAQLKKLDKIAGI